MLPKELFFEMHIYGMPEREISYTQKLKSIALKYPQVKFHNSMPHHDILHEYAKLDAVIIPSEIFETGPYTLLEALYSGCHVLASSNVGQLSLVQKYGKIVAPNSPSEWSKVLSETLNNISQWRVNPINIENADIRLMEHITKQLCQRIKHTIR